MRYQSSYANLLPSLPFQQLLHELSHAFGSTHLQMVEGAGGVPLHWFGVDKPDRRTMRHTTGKSCGRIDIETCTNDHQHIGLHAKFCCYLYIRNLLTEPYNIRTQRTTVGSLISILHLGILGSESYYLRRGIGRDATRYLR